MDKINDGIRFINGSIDACTDYIKENAIQLVIIGALIYYLKNRKQQDKGYTLSQSRPAAAAATNSSCCDDASKSCDTDECSSSSSSKNATTTTTSRSPRDAHLVAVRERQQALANQRAQEAAKLRKEKQQQEKDRKNHVATKKIDTSKGDVLGGNSGGATTFRMDIGTAYKKRKICWMLYG
ncbi:MAG: hypothetical protein SGBAC_000617 [Bacillariaceae sp.]